MTGLSIALLWEKASAFLRRESALLIPVALATFGLGIVLMGLMAPVPSTSQGVKPGAWMLWMVPMALLAILGNLAISALTLKPGTSVREAMERALWRLPAALGVLLLMLAFWILLMIVAGVILNLLNAGRISVEALAMQTLAISMFPMLWMSIRLFAIWPLVVDRDLGPIAAIRAGIRMTHGHFIRLMSYLALFILVYMLLTGIGEIVIGSLVKLLGMMLGGKALVTAIGIIAMAVIVSLLAMVWAVIVAQVYRALSD